ncbi:hypothetical protein IV102_22455 [bacterium]|nr:hypothetical protein [bacterium]
MSITQVKGGTATLPTTRPQPAPRSQSSHVSGDTFTPSTPNTTGTYHRMSFVSTVRCVTKTSATGPWLLLADAGTAAQFSTLSLSWTRPEAPAPVRKIVAVPPRWWRAQ